MTGQKSKSCAVLLQLACWFDLIIPTPMLCSFLLTFLCCEGEKDVTKLRKYYCRQQWECLKYSSCQESSILLPLWWKSMSQTSVTSQMLHGQLAVNIVCVCIVTIIPSCRSMYWIWGASKTMWRVDTASYRSKNHWMKCPDIWYLGSFQRYSKFEGSAMLFVI